MKSAKELRDDYLTLLSGGHEEQIYQRFIEQNTRLVPRDFVQNHGVHLSLVLRKLSFGADYKSDFFFFSKSSDDWNAVFIEIEKPTSRFFKNGSHEFHRDFVAALQQINCWRAWLAIDGNKQSLVNQLNTICVPARMQRNPTHSKFILVFGRRSEYQDSELRRSRIHAEEREDFKIITFDSLAESLEAKRELYVGVRRNEFIDIQSDEIVDDNLFMWADPNMLTVNERLHTKIKARVATNKPTPLGFTGHLTSNFHPNALEVAVCSDK